jgi:hypothetical protein
MKHRYVHKDSQVWLKVPIQRRNATTPLTCHGMLIVAYLLHRAGKNDGATQRRIRHALSMDADTVRNQLSDLAAGGLVAKDGGNWRILDSNRLDELFEVLRNPQKNERVGDRLCYVRTYLPTPEARKNGLTLNTVLLYWRLVDWAKEVEKSGGLGAIHPSLAGQRGRRKGLSIPYLVEAMKSDPKTIRASLARLEKLGLIRRTVLGTGYFAVGIIVEESQCCLWRKTWTLPSEASFQQLFGAAAVAKPAVVELPDAQKLFLSAGIPGPMHQELLDLIEKAGLDLYEWKPVLLQCKNDHDRNRVEGRTKVTHPGRLFHYELSNRIKTKNVSLAYQPRSGSQDLAVNSIRRIPGSSERFVSLIEEAVSAGSVPTSNGSAVPVPIGWNEILTLTNNATFDGFRQAFVKRVFEAPQGGLSPWLDQIMMADAIPDDTWDLLRAVMGKSLGLQHSQAWEKVQEWAELQWDDSATRFRRTTEIVDAALAQLHPVIPPDIPSMDRFWACCRAYIDYMSPEWFGEEPSQQLLPAYPPETQEQETLCNA